jgi:hypothetical protein
MNAARPESIVRFECLALVAVAVSIVGRERKALEFDLAGDLVVPGLFLWLIFRIARNRSLSARSIYTGIGALSLCVGSYGLATGASWVTVNMDQAVLCSLLGTAQFLSLWASTSSEWLRAPLKAEVRGELR